MWSWQRRQLSSACPPLCRRCRCPLHTHAAAGGAEVIPTQPPGIQGCSISLHGIQRRGAGWRWRRRRRRPCANAGASAAPACPPHRLAAPPCLLGPRRPLLGPPLLLLLLLPSPPLHLPPRQPCALRPQPQPLPVPAQPGLSSADRRRGAGGRQRMLSRRELPGPQPAAAGSLPGCPVPAMPPGQQAASLPAPKRDAQHAP